MPDFRHRPVPSVLDWESENALGAAVATLRGIDGERARAALGRVKSALPPVCATPGIVSLAQRVLRGETDAVRGLQNSLDYFDSWSAKRYPSRPARRSATESRKLIEKWSRAKPPKHHDDHGAGLARSEAVVTLMAAAALCGARDPAVLIHNVDVMHEQLGMIDLLAPLVRDARRTLDGDPGAREGFLHGLVTLGEEYEFAVPGRLPPFPGGPIPFPSSPLPPPGLPLPPGFPWELPEVEDEFPALCSARAVQGILAAIGSATCYRINEFVPERACPGDTLTIKGRGFDQPGYKSVRVMFPTGGDPIPATPLSRTDTKITVVIPGSAVCGQVTLDIDAVVRLEHCGASLDYSPYALHLAGFEGGGTRILKFEAVGSKDAGRCLHAGEVVSFVFRTCNCDSIQLSFEIENTCGGFKPIVVDLPASARSYEYTLPSLECHSLIKAVLLVRGPCGEARESICIGVQATGAAAPNFPQELFANWHSEAQIGLCDRPTIMGAIRTATPTNLASLVSAVASIPAGQEVGVKGSGWSFTDCVAPAGTGYLIDTSKLQRVLKLPPLLDRPVSVLSQRVLDRLHAPDLKKRLVHVQAGIKIHRLNCELECRGLAMPTLGGSNGQALGGVMGTGTHGGNPVMPPIVDLVRAIHLVGPGGQQWWIEPADAPITDSDAMRTEKEKGEYDPCLRVVYDTDLFRACLVAFGSAGVIYSVVVEVVPKHCLLTNTEIHPWSYAKALAQSMVVAPPDPSQWFLELSLNPTRRCWVTTREPTVMPITPVEPNRDPLPEVLALLFGPAVLSGGVGAIVGLGTGAIGALLGALPFYFAKRALLYSFYVMTFQWGRLRELQDEVELIKNLDKVIRAAVDAIASGGDEAAVARLLPHLLNVVWQVGFYIVSGREIIEKVQEIFTSTSRPTGRTVLKSFRAMTGQQECVVATAGGDCEKTTYEDPPQDAKFIRLVHSMEYVLPAERALAFADELLAVVDIVRQSSHAVLFVLSMRFTRGTRALLGMQQGDKVGHLELYVFDGMAGNAALLPLIDATARAFGAIPHWGQFHNAASRFERLYPELDRWRDAMDRIAIEGGASRNVFRHAFARSRQLLENL